MVYKLTWVLCPRMTVAQAVSTTSVKGDLVLTGDGIPAACQDVNTHCSQETELESGQKACVCSQFILLGG